MKRFLAHVIIEAKTPLKVGGGKNDLFLDAPVQRDWNGLPMILGTSVAGILRRTFEDNIDKGAANEIFGTRREEGNKSESKKESKDENLNLVGSRLIVSNALLVDEKGKVCEELLLEKSRFLRYFDILPIRDHVAIGANGTAKDAGKFDEEVVFKGTRFKFSLELDGSKEEFERILNLLSDPALRLGGGSSKGFGSLGILEIKWGEFEPDRYSSSLNFSSDEFVKFMPNSAADGNLASKKFIRYELKISPDDFFMFGSGFGDNEADHTPVIESIISYKTGKLSEQKILIPASSVKGALSHRTAFHFNKINKQFVEKAKVGSENEAVKEIFGYEKNKNNKGAKGKILISDCFLDYDEAKDTKVFEHVSIDRFTGGAIDSALFQEKAVAKRDEFIIEILLKNDVCGDKENEAFDNALGAFEAALDDVVQGRLSLGGATTKGYGFFKGKVLKYNEGRIENEKE